MSLEYLMFFIKSSTMYQVIYDISKQEYQYFNGDLIVPIILLIIIIGTFSFIIDSYKTKKKEVFIGE